MSTFSRTFGLNARQHKYLFYFDTFVIWGSFKCGNEICEFIKPLILNAVYIVFVLIRKACYGALTLPDTETDIDTSKITQNLLGICV